MDPEPFLRGRAFPGTPRVPYPRARPEDAARLPADTWAVARIPVGVRLELTGDAEAVEIAYETATDDLGSRGRAAGSTFALWREGHPVDERPALLGSGTVRLETGDGAPADRIRVYLPEGMRPRVLDVDGVGGALEPAPPQRRWVVYGDSIAEGWCASAPAMAWPAVAGRERGFDVVNMGYAGAARGEIVSAEHVGEVPAEAVTICYGTNCWSRVPFSAGMLREGLRAFLDVVRQGHRTEPIVVASPVVRPDAEAVPNRLGATLADLRGTIEEVVRERMRADDRLGLVPGLELIEPGMLADGLHPNDAGHARLAAAMGAALADLLD